MAGVGVFDDAERERIRRALLRYAEEHRMGAPTLRSQIMDADEPRFRELTLSTLQRFLSGAHRTLDMYVEMCSRFLASVGRAAVPEFGQALARFIGHAASPEAQVTVDGSLLAAIAGSYESTVYPETDLAFAGDPANDFLHVEEIVHGRRPANTERRDRSLHEGVAVARGGRVYAVMRNSLTREPKYYTLSFRAPAAGAAGAAALEGDAFETSEGSDTPRHLQVRLTAKSR